MTQEELAGRARLSRVYIVQLEMGRKSPTVQVLLRVCKALGIKASRIIAKIESND